MLFLKLTNKLKRKSSSDTPSIQDLEQNELFGDDANCFRTPFDEKLRVAGMELKVLD